MNADDITVGELKELAKILADEKNLTLGDWKVLVKNFAKEKGLTNKEATDLTRIAYRSFGW